MQGQLLHYMQMYLDTVRHKLLCIMFKCNHHASPSIAPKVHEDVYVSIEEMRIEPVKSGQ